jgi:ribonuclease HI
MQRLLSNALSDKQHPANKKNKRGRDDLPLFHLYTDGSSSHITNEGGWAYIIYSDDGFVTQDYGYEKTATNNSMELKAAIEGIWHLASQKCHINLYSDSAYMINTLRNEWWKDWEKNGWVKRDGVPTPNSGYWRELIYLLKFNPISLIKVKAHSGDKLNDYCDKLAKEARKTQGLGVIEIDLEEG